jgi:hypothetical protein
VSVHGHSSTFAGLPIVAYDPERALPDDPSAVAWRVEAEEFEAPPEEFAALLRSLVDAVPTGDIRALVIGEWGSAYETAPPLDLLCELAPGLPGLRALFLGDLVSEQCEISWIHHDDITGLIAAYPGLEALWVRGADGLDLAPVTHGRLRELAFESGGLPADVVSAIGASELPALEHLELWLGTPEYGANATVDDLAGILSGERLPALRYLGLRNAEIADQLAAAVAAAPITARVEVLDLSLGVLTDEGAAALLAGAPLTHLRRLDLHHHYLSDEWQARIVAALPGVEVDVSDVQEPDEYDGESERYVAVGE